MAEDEALKLAELEVERLIEVCLKQGLSSAQILRLLLSACIDILDLPKVPY